MDNAAMESLADRFGRRLLVIGSLAIYVLSFAGYLLASTALGLILMRAVTTALTAGLAPAVIGVVADIAPVERRGQWIGIVSGAASFGWAAGPIFGGVFYDRWAISLKCSISPVGAALAPGQAL